MQQNISFSWTNLVLSQITSDCLVIACYKEVEIFSTFLSQALDNEKVETYLKSWLSHQSFQAESGQIAILSPPADLAIKHILWIGCGHQKDENRVSLKNTLQTIRYIVQNLGCQSVIFYFPKIVQQFSIRTALPFVWALQEAFYTFKHLKKASRSEKSFLFTFYSLSMPSNADKELSNAFLESLAFIKDLGNLPANYCTPSYLAQEAKRVTSLSPHIECQVLEKEHIQALGMGALLAVSQGSIEPPKFITLSYKGVNDKPIVFIGKGVTFDAGGINLKPSSSALHEMKFDMCGAATVLALIYFAAKIKLPLHLVGIVPAVENMISGSAIRPGDVVHSLSGKTIEILNTDAEGRLILADALTYAQKYYEPQAIIDLATLTGAIISTLGYTASGIMGNNAALIKSLLEAAQASGDKAWELPLWREYQELLESDIADMNNQGDKIQARSIVGACFLDRFVQNVAWAHLDIAGTAYIPGKNFWATGRPFPLLIYYLLNKISSPDTSASCLE